MTKKDNLDRAFRMVTEGDWFISEMIKRCNREHPDLKITAEEARAWVKQRNDNVLGKA